MNIINPKNIDLAKITIEKNGYVNYEGSQLFVQTGWMNAFYNKDYKKITTRVKEDDILKDILNKLSKIIKKNAPEGTKPIELLKKGKYLQPKCEYSCIYDAKKNKSTMEDMIKNPVFKVRFILTIPKLKVSYGYFGANLKATQLQYSSMALPEVKRPEYMDYLFADEIETDEDAPPSD